MTNLSKAPKKSMDDMSDGDLRRLARVARTIRLRPPFCCHAASPLGELLDLAHQHGWRADATLVRDGELIHFLPAGWR